MIHELLKLLILISLPIGVLTIVGLVLGIFTTSMQINESAIPFGVKSLFLILFILIFGNFYLESFNAFTNFLIKNAV